MEQKTNSKGLTARILGGHPTAYQKIIVWFMLLTLLLWPIGIFVSVFFWDAPIQSSIDEISRWGVTLTIWLYPIYLFPLIRLWFKLSKRMGMTWLFYLCPLIPVVVFYLFLSLASNVYEERKPEGYDPSTYKSLNAMYALDANQVYYGNKILEGADPSTFKVLSGNYATDMHHVWYNDYIIEGADPASFVVLKGLYYAQDKHRVYYEAYGTAIRDFNTLRHKNMENGMYNAFHTDGTTIYNPKLLPMPTGTDFLTIYRVKEYRDWYADKERVYYENRLLSGANPQTFMIFPSHYVNEDYVSDNNLNTEYSHDGNNVFYRDSLMSGADIASFICGYDFVEEQSFAFDKNRYYQGTPNPRIEKLRKDDGM